MTLARELIDADAEKVVRRLSRRGHKAYLVGGCVRDLLLSRTPKDFDVSTSATPNEIKQLFRNCRIIGRRFRLAHIFFGQKTIETSTFRANPRHDEDAEDAELLIRRDNVFGTATEDAQRRDFTINGLFYDVSAERVIDHVGGLQDLDARVIRTIGVPEIRFQEDPVRMLRAVKFAARLDFSIEPETYDALVRHRREILKCAPPRVLEEIYRMLRGGAARKSLRLLLDTGLARVLSPALAELFGDRARKTQEQDGVADAPPEVEPPSEEEEWAATWEEKEPEPLPRPDRTAQGSAPAVDEASQREAQRELAWKGLDQLDVMVRRSDRITNALILATLSYPFVIEDLLRPGMRPIDANAVLLRTLAPVVEQLHVARRDAERTRQVLLAQRRLAPSRRRRGRPMALVRRDYFDEALSTYAIGALAAGRDTADVLRWQKLKSEGSDSRRQERQSDSRGKRRRRRRGGRRRRRSRQDDKSDGPVGDDPHAAASP